MDFVFCVFKNKQIEKLFIKRMSKRKSLHVYIVVFIYLLAIRKVNTHTKPYIKMEQTNHLVTTNVVEVNTSSETVNNNNNNNNQRPSTPTTVVQNNNNNNNNNSSSSNSQNAFANDVVQNTSNILRTGREEVYRSFHSPLSETSQRSPSSYLPLQQQQQQYSSNYIPPSPPATTSHEYFYQAMPHTMQQQKYRRNVQLDDIKYQLDRSLHLLRRELDNRIERIEEDVSRTRIETNKLRGVAFLREEDHLRILSSIQQLKETNALISNTNVSLEQKLKLYPTRNEMDTFLLSTIDPIKSEFNTKIDHSSQQLKKLNNIYLKVDKEIKRQAKISRNNNNNNNNGLGDISPIDNNSDKGGNSNAPKINVEYIIEQVEARLFHRLEKMIVDRVDLISLRSQDKLFNKFNDSLNDKISKVIQSEVQDYLKKSSFANGGGGRAGLLLNEHDVYHKKQYQKKDAKYAEERLIMKDSMKQIGKEQKLMQNSLISLRTQVRALARVVSSVKGDVATLMKIQQEMALNDTDKNNKTGGNEEVVPLGLYHSR